MTFFHVFQPSLKDVSTCFFGLKSKILYDVITLDLCLINIVNQFRKEASLGEEASCNNLAFFKKEEKLR